MDADAFIKNFHDHLAPKLDMYEQAIYLYAIRHSRLIGQRQVVIGFKSARKKMAFGIGKQGTPPSEHVVYQKVRSLQSKGCLRLIASERSGTRIEVFLPTEIEGLIRFEEHVPEIDLEVMDFFHDPKNRQLILERENYKCFYCMRELNSDNYVIEHVVSRPEGDSSYRNVVAACRECNNRKSNTAAEDYVRSLYRENCLSMKELTEVLAKLGLLKAGELKPNSSNY